MVFEKEVLIFHSLFFIRIRLQPEVFFMHLKANTLMCIRGVSLSLISCNFDKMILQICYFMHNVLDNHSENTGI